MKRQDSLIAACHDGLTDTSNGNAMAGHFGRDKCFHLLVTRYCFPLMRERIQRYIRTCDRCQRVNTHNLGKGGAVMHPIPVPSQFWCQIGVDLVGPMPDYLGMKYIVTAVCYYTKWIEASPVRDKCAQSIAWFLYRIHCRFGMSEIMITDQGGQKICTQYILSYCILFIIYLSSACNMYETN